MARCSFSPKSLYTSAGVKGATGSAGRVQPTFRVPSSNLARPSCMPGCGPQVNTHGGTMKKSLPARPNLDHLRTQAKHLLADLQRGDQEAARTFLDYLPAAKKMTSARAQCAGFRLADAQSAIARKSGFAAWPALARHVAQLRALEGEWRFESLEVDGTAMPAGMLGASRLLMDGDRFRTEAPEAIYEDRKSTRRNSSH